MPVKGADRRAREAAYPNGIPDELRHAYKDNGDTTAVLKIMRSCPHLGSRALDGAAGVPGAAHFTGDLTATKQVISERVAHFGRLCQEKALFLKAGMGCVPLDSLDPS